MNRMMAVYRDLFRTSNKRGCTWSCLHPLPLFFIIAKFATLRIEKIQYYHSKNIICMCYFYFSLITPQNIRTVEFARVQGRQESRSEQHLEAKQRIVVRWRCWTCSSREGSHINDIFCRRYDNREPPTKEKEAEPLNSTFLYAYFNNACAIFSQR